MVKDITVSETPFNEILIALSTNFLIDSLSVIKNPLSEFRTTRSSKYVVNMIAAYINKI